ncbi:ABC-type multidrug transport system, ATPase component [Desulfocurvibacter africanus PCS]|uniref:ABC-type multidrug transport system, ATPase component n=1 Tax=Desulfocurvibacter africanus PCS TaxID=1262666 RepID=M5PQR4_DESAF|nr:ATP-binding cassette domain-containing protein [Desulfocurvibacter africanus]EMG36380.1 ABC-type multidrug transport system, ATPase component [Desulfocurvibacter africanus PCS]
MARSDEPLARADGVLKRFGPGRPALDHVSAEVPPGMIVGLVGPDGAGKTTLLRLMAGLLRPNEGSVMALGFDTSREPEAVHARIGYMPQKFGLYEDLSVMENLRLYADLRGLPKAERAGTFERLLSFTDLARFTSRLAGRLSGGMKQKLGLACAMIRKPALLLLDEPSVGVDPISRRELWRMVQDLKADGIGVVWSTSYLDEAEACDLVLLLNDGKLLFSGKPHELTGRVAGRVFQVRGIEGRRRQVLRAALEQQGVIDGVIQGESVRVVLGEGAKRPDPQGFGAGGSSRLDEVRPRFEDAFLDILGGVPGGVSSLAESMAPVQGDGRAVIEAKGLTKLFGDFAAAKDVSFAIRRGEIFGLLGPNGAGKSTTFKMMCGLLKPTRGQALVDGLDLQAAPGEARARIGYMAQKFSLYGNLSVRQNLDFFSGVYGLTGGRQREVVERMIGIFGLKPHLATSADELPLGFKQRLALSCAVMHEPVVLFLDEPTSGVDPLTRREFWTHINGIVEKGVTVMVTTHFMDEAEYCDRIGLVYRGQVIATGSPDDLKASVRSEELPDPAMEDAFIALVQSHDMREEAA